MRAGLGYRAVRVLGGLALLLFLLYPWPALRSAHARCFRASWEAAFRILGVPVEFRALPPTDGDLDTVLIVAESAGSGSWGQRCSSWFVGLVPTAVFLALWCGTRLPRSSSLRLLLVGMLSVQAFVLARVGILLLSGWTFHARSRPEHGHPELLTRPAWDRTMRALLDLHYDPIAYVLVPVLVWITLLLWLRERPAS
jgi:hypothetical protein